MNPFSFFRRKPEPTPEPTLKAPRLRTGDVVDRSMMFHIEPDWHGPNTHFAFAHEGVVIWDGTAPELLDLVRSHVR